MTATLHTPVGTRGPTSERSSRLQTVRRIYFYLVTLISSTAGLIAIGGLLASLTDTLLPGNTALMLGGSSYMRRSIALSAGLLVVTTPLFLIHWRVIGASLDQPGEQGAGMRKFMLYVVSAIALVRLAGASGDLIDGVARLAMGDGLQNSPIWPSAWALDLGMATVAGLLLFYWQWVLRQDGDFGTEHGTSLIWRRLFLAGITLAGLALLVFGSATLFSALLQRLLEVGAPTIHSNWFVLNTASGIAQILVGAMMARTTWQVWEAIMARNPGEQLSALRRLFLYVAVIGGAVATLVPAALGLRRLLLWSFTGFDGPWIDVALQLVSPVSFIPAGILIWRAFAVILHRLEAIEEGGSAEEMPDAATATVRRIYHYAVSATGLVLLWIGAGNVLQVILDRLITAPDVVGETIWQGPLARGLSLLAVAAPSGRCTGARCSGSRANQLAPGWPSAPLCPDASTSMASVWQAHW